MNNTNTKNNYRPVTFVNGKVSQKHADDKGRQMMLLKAMSVTSDPKKLKQMIGVRTVAEVFRTLDKMAMRKEYHQALLKRGLDFDYIVHHLQELVEKSNGQVKLGAVQTLLKSLGMDKYDVADQGSAGNWEDILAEKLKEEEDVPLLEDEDYDVEEPEIPDSVKSKIQRDKDLTGHLGDNDVEDYELR